MTLRGVALLARAGAPTHVAVAAGHGLRRDRLRRRLVGLAGPGGRSCRTGRRAGGRSSCGPFGVARLAHGPERVHLAHRRFTWPTLRPGCDSSGRRGLPERAWSTSHGRHASAPSALWMVFLLVAMAGAAFTNDGPGSRGRVLVQHRPRRLLACHSPTPVRVKSAGDVRFPHTCPGTAPDRANLVQFRDKCGDTSQGCVCSPLAGVLAFAARPPEGRTTTTTDRSTPYDHVRAIPGRFGPLGGWHTSSNRRSSRDRDGFLRGSPPTTCEGGLISETCQRPWTNASQPSSRSSSRTLRNCRRCRGSTSRR